MTTENDQLEKIRDMIKDVKFGMLTTVDENRQLSSRPLTSQQVDASGNIWFFISDEATFLNAVRQNPEVNASFSNVDDSLYVSISGRAQVLRNRQKAEELWNVMAKPWFPSGVDDPHLMLLKVQIHAAEYWDSGSSKMMQLFAMAKAAVTGEQPKNIGEHGVLQP
ncbi:pyridoxamine 5'-phosphate oxidase family protein [Undibacterium sp. TJN19]|uniref:pyridoxamine 5'-phosphate oxidase family protein n=1 Tax=Undibacterium sp. TJN19 TaxID=3413055 RepID=UPI003BF37B23